MAQPRKQELFFGSDLPVMTCYYRDKRFFNLDNFGFNGRDKIVCSSASRPFFDFFILFIAMTHLWVLNGESRKYFFLNHRISVPDCPMKIIILAFKESEIRRKLSYVQNLRVQFSCSRCVQCSETRPWLKKWKFMVGKQGLRAFVQSKKANEESRIVGMDIFKATSTVQIWKKT